MLTADELREIEICSLEEGTNPAGCHVRELIKSHREALAEIASLKATVEVASHGIEEPAIQATVCDEPADLRHVDFGEAF